MIDRRQFLLGSLGGAAALAVAGCTSRSSPSSSAAAAGGRPTLRLPQGATGFPSPFAANADIGYNQMSLIYDTLLWKDGDGQLLPWLAASWTVSEDHLTYTFVLRDGVKWADGRPFTADDVTFTFDYYAAQVTLSPPIIIQPPQGIAKVRAVDPTTVEITLKSPQVTFPEQVVGAVPIIPKQVWAPIKDPASAQDRKVLVGTGPYRLASYDGDGGELLYLARDDYFLGPPYVRRIEERAIDDQFAGLLANNTDIARGQGLRPDTIAPFTADKGYAVVTQSGSTSSPLYWNMGREGPLSDVRFRRACAMAIDRRDLVTRLASGRGLPGNPGFLSPANPSYVPVPQYDFDVAGANALLDAAGYRLPPGAGVRQGPRGPLSFGLLMSNGDAALSELLVADFKRVGIEVKPKLVQIGPQLFGAKLVGDFDMAVLFFPGPGPGGPSADPDILRLLFSSRLSASLEGAASYANPTFDDLADRQRETFDDAERKALVAQMQAILADDLPMLPLFYPEVAIVYRTKVLDQYYFTPGQFPAESDNKQLFVTGAKAGTQIRHS
ncbi:MAG: ABC transporter substrate-binding protein [Acidimicrobiales bacterium]